MKVKAKKLLVLRVRRHVPPPGRFFKDKKKAASRKACRGRVWE